MIRFYNGKVLTLKNRTKITDDEVWTDGKQIVYVGKNCKEKADKEINLHGNLLMPSFKNAHTHSSQAAFLPALICITFRKQWQRQV